MPIKHHNEIKPTLPLALGTGLYLTVDYRAVISAILGTEWWKKKVEGGVPKCCSCRSLALPVSLAAIQTSEQRDGEKSTGCNVYLLCNDWGCRVKWAAGFVLLQYTLEIGEGLCHMITDALQWPSGGISNKSWSPKSCYRSWITWAGREASR